MTLVAIVHPAPSPGPSPEGLGRSHIRKSVFPVQRIGLSSDSIVLVCEGVRWDERR